MTINFVSDEVLDENIKIMEQLGAKLVTPHKHDNSWHERGELPPVGCECEIMHKCWIEPNEVKIAAITKEYVIVVDGQREQHYHLRDITFRPLRTGREKAIDAACVAVGGVGEDGLLIIERLYDAGMMK